MKRATSRRDDAPMGDLAETPCDGIVERSPDPFGEAFRQPQGSGARPLAQNRGFEVVTDTHHSGQHKDREAAAAEVRRMWQPTPSWSQPDSASTPAQRAEVGPSKPEAESEAASET